MLDIDTTRIPQVDKIIPFCKVISMGSGSIPKFITVELPNSDGARTNAWYTGNPSNLAVDDYVRIQRQAIDKRYVVEGYDQTGADLAGDTVKVSSNDTTPGYLNGKLVAGDNITLTENNDGSNETLTIASTATSIGQNLLYDSIFSNVSFPESASSSNHSDDSYFNLWNIIHNAGTTGPTVTQQAGGSSDPFEYYLRVAAGQNSTRTGIVQFLEAKDAKSSRGSPASISFDIWSPTILGMRATLVEWAGTADTITSDVVSDWTNSDPTLAANWSYITGNPGASFTVTSSRTRVTIEGLTVGSSVNNLALFVWTGTENTGAYFNIGRVKVEPNSAATDFVARSVSDELARIQRHLEVDTASPADGVASVMNYMGAAFSSGAVQCFVPWKARKRVAPTVSLYRSDQGASNGNWAYFDGSFADATTTVATPKELGMLVNLNKSGAFTANNAHMCNGHWKADARL